MTDRTPPRAEPFLSDLDERKRVTTDAYEAERLQRRQALTSIATQLLTARVSARHLARAHFTDDQLRQEAYQCLSEAGNIYSAVSHAMVESDRLGGY